MKQGCKGTEDGCQKWAKMGKLKDNMNLTLDEISKRLKDEYGAVYSYVLTTVKNKGGDFVQTGSAPNFQGGLITLCSCKHNMRTYRDTLNWVGVWIAGFTSIDIVSDKKNYLFYLMKISGAYLSQKEIWDRLSKEVKNDKNSRLNICGDLYEPKQECNDEFSYSNYHAPIGKHVHENNDDWHKDIDYENIKTRRRPSLLVGDPHHSFLWSRPILYFPDKHPRTKKWNIIQDIIALLGE